MNIEGQ